MQRIVPVLAFAFLFATVAAISPGANAQVLGEPGHVSGQICYSAPGEAFSSGSDGGCWRGLPAATLRFQKPASGLQSAVDESFATDEFGFYGANLDQGRYSLSITRAGFEPSNHTVDVGQDTTFDAVVAPQEKQISGKVLAPEGSGIGKASVSLWAPDRSVRATTDADGSFSFRVYSGHYSIEVTAPGYVGATFERFLDGSSLSLQLKNGPKADATIKGIVEDQDGAPVADAHVRINQWGGYEDSSQDGTYYHGHSEVFTTTAADGSYSLAVRSGDYGLEVYKDGHASFHDWGQIASGASKTVDVELLKYPPKSAHLVGKIVDASSGKSIGAGSISANNPEYGIYSCSSYASEAQYYAEPEPAFTIAPGERYPHHENRCDIQINEDGTFEGNLTPGYTVFNVYHDHWRTCNETQNGDGSYIRNCGPEYYSWAGVVTLVEGENTLTIRLQKVPAAETTVQGYVVDAETQKAIAGATINFWNQDGRGYGWAQTDKDGSFKILLRGGYHGVSVYADGYFHWESTVSLPSKGTFNFDATLTQGESRYGGGCCYAYQTDDAAVSHEASSASGSSSSSSSGGSSGQSLAAPEMDGGSADARSTSGSSSDEYQDLGGGLGPYDAKARQKELGESGKDSPGLGLVLVGVGLLAFAARYRRD